MTGSVKYRKGQSWYYVVDLPPGLHGQRRQKKKGGFRTKGEASKAMSLYIANDRDDAVVTSNQRLGSFLEEWLDSVSGSLAPNTLALHQLAARRWIAPRIGHKTLGEITPRLLQSFYAELEKSGRCDGKGGLSPRSVRQAHVTLSLAFKRAVAWGLVAKNPAVAKDDEIALPRMVKPVMRTWTADECQRFLDTSKDSAMGPLWTLLLSTGLRRGEALGLAWEAVHLDGDNPRLAVRQTLVAVSHGTAFSEPKSKASRRVVSLLPAAVTALRAQQVNQTMQQADAGTAWRPSDLVFTNAVGGPLDPTRTRRKFDKAIREADVLPIRIHDTRHTFATLALEAGVHPKLVQEILGHSSIAMTLDLYSHVTPVMHQEAMGKVGGVLFGSK